MSKTKATIALDVDDVTGNLVQWWLDCYNEDWGDTLKIEQITDWDFSKFVKPECGKEIYSYLNNPGFYNGVVPVEGALDGINLLREQFERVIFVTALDTYPTKFNWMVQYGVLTREQRSDFIVCKDKRLIRADVLVDDNIDNILTFPGKGVLFSRPWNEDQAYRLSHPNQLFSRDWSSTISAIYFQFFGVDGVIWNWVSSERK